MALQVGVEAQAVVPLALQGAVPVVFDGIVRPAGQQLGQHGPLAGVMLRNKTKRLEQSFSSSHAL